MTGRYRYIIAFDFTEPDGVFVSEKNRVNTDFWSSKAIKTQNIFAEESIQEEELKSLLPNQIKSPEVTSKADYRFSAITLTIANPTSMLKKRSSSTEPLKAKFMGYGVVRLYKEYDTTKEANEIEVESDDTTVAIVAVPNYFSATDLLVFLGEDVTENVSHFRLIKSDNPNRFMVLMKFRNNESARTFQDCFNGKSFNSMESETCHVIFVKSVIFRPLNSKNLQAGIPYLLEDPFTLQVKKSHQESGGLESSVVKELPTCPVCLERMDSEASGLLTISCQHTFHCNCLSKWRDDTCPVCRYSNLSTNPLTLRDPSNSQDSCSVCGGEQNLWICLICGNIGCGRYNSKHAIQHYENTNHCFAMDIATQRVWDYAGDNYVHRLLQNEADGKLVELPANNSTANSPSSDEKDKNRDYTFEYSNVLLSQLESQREYYESRLAESADAFNKVCKQNEAMNTRLGQFEGKIEEVTQTFSKVQLEMKSRTESVNQKFKQVDQLKKLAQTFEQKWKEEQAITQGLSENLNKVKKENQSLKAQNEELQSQVTDLMFYLESQDKFKDASEDVKNGTVVVQENSTPRRHRKK